MNIAKCNNGHFFDREGSVKCPYCGESEESAESGEAR